VSDGRDAVGQDMGFSDGEAKEGNEGKTLFQSSLQREECIFDEFKTPMFDMLLYKLRRQSVVEETSLFVVIFENGVDEEFLRGFSLMLEQSDNGIKLQRRYLNPHPQPFLPGL